LIRSAVLDDVSRIAEIKISGWRYAYRDILSDYELFAKRQVIKAIEGIRSKLLDEASIIVYEEGDIIKGYAWYGVTEDAEGNNAYEIFSIYVQPEFTRKGIGSELLRAVETKTGRGRRDRVLLWVLEKNHDGVKFYRKNGYAEDGMVKIIPEWREKQIRMVKELKNQLPGNER